MRVKPLSLALALLLLAMVFAVPSASVGQPGLPSLQVELEPVGEVNTDPVEFKHVHTTATVSIHNFPLGVTVNVNATTDNYWLVTVDPATITVPQGTPSKEETVDLDIRVPPRASADRVVNLLIYVNATTTIGLEYGDEDSTNITVRQYYGLQVTTNGTISIEQGKNLTHRMRVTNTGNGKDDLNILLTNEGTLSGAGIDLEFDAKVNEVGQDRTVSVLVSVQAERDANIGTHEALFTITSGGDPSEKATYRLTINVREGTGGNGSNGGSGDGDEEDEANYAVYGGIIIAVLVLLGLIIFLGSRGMEERGLEEDEGDRM